MTTYTIDCARIRSKDEFWNKYIAIVEPEGSVYFGRNLDALWDALSGGGPGFPGESECSIKLVNTDPIKLIDSGAFWGALMQISYDLKIDPYSKIAFTLE